MTEQANAISLATRSDDEFADDLEALEKRARRFGYLNLWSSIFCVANLLIAGGFYWSGSAIEVLAPFSDLHVPDVVMKSVSDAVQSITVAPGGGHIDSGIQNFVTVMADSWVPKVLAVIAIIGGLLTAVMRGSMGVAIMPLMMAGPLMFAPSLLKSISGAPADSGESRISERAHVEKLLEDKDWKAAVETLVAKAKITDVQRQYLEGQLHYLQLQALDAQKETAKDAGTQAKEQLSRYLRNFEPSKDAAADVDRARLYTMEMAAFNAPWSKPSKDYAQAQAEKKQSRLSWASIFKSFSWPFGCAAGAFGLIAFAFRRRVRRIRTLINPHYVEGGMSSGEPRGLTGENDRRDESHAEGLVSSQADSGGKMST